MNTKRYYVVKANDCGTEYYIADNEWTWIKSKAKSFDTEKEACEIKNNLKNNDKFTINTQLRRL